MLRQVKLVVLFGIVAAIALSTASGAVSGSKLEKFIKHTIGCAGCGDDNPPPPPPSE
jgi:hypothetical protein